MQSGDVSKGKLEGAAVRSMPLWGWGRGGWKGGLGPLLCPGFLPPAHEACFFWKTTRCPV